MNIIDIIKPKQHTTLKGILVHKLKGLAQIIAAFAIGLILVHWFTAGQDNIIGSQMQDAPSVAPLPDKGALVLEEHKDECWTGSQAPKAELPGAAIVKFEGSERVIYTKEHKLVDAAFNEALASAGYGDKTSKQIDVVALCV